MRKHVPRVFVAFPSIGPFLTSFVLVATIVAKSTRFGAVGDHVTRAVVALAIGGPTLAIGVFVAAVGPMTSLSTTTTAATTCSSTTGARRDAIAIVPSLESVAQKVFDPLTIAGAELRRARPFRTWLRADALTLVVLVARLFAVGVGGAMLGATIHDVHDSLVGVSQVLLGPDGKLKVLISSDHSHSSVVGKGIWSIVHN